MFDEMTDVRLSFLTSGPMYGFRMPSGFAQTPELGSAVFNGVGSRKFVFLPWERDQGTDDGSVLVDTIKDKDGREVEILRRPGDPALWWLAWSLSAGGLYSHLREEEGPGYAAVEVPRISISETPGPAPYAIFDVPLKPMTSSAPGYQDRAIFYSPVASPGWWIAISRPSFLSSGQVVQVASADSPDVTKRQGTSLNLEILVTTPTSDDTSRLLDEVSSSLEIA